MLSENFLTSAHKWGQVLTFEGQTCSTFKGIYHELHKMSELEAKILELERLIKSSNLVNQ